MKVVFRVDASLLIGSGHVMRCLVLADYLKKIGHDVQFACSPLEGDMRRYIGERGYHVITLSNPQQAIIPTNDADYVAWLQKSVVQDADDFVEAIFSVDLVITDHYAIGKEWQRKVKRSLNCRLLAIDDLGRNHDADIVLDQTLGRSESVYLGSAVTVLAGSEYALLNSAFSCKRELALSRELTLNRPKVLVSMGAVDAPNATIQVLKCLTKQVNAHFTVLLSPRSPHYREVKHWCSSKENVVHLDFISDMATLMLEHDIAIGAPGTTSWERACLGLPNIIIPLAENQLLISDQLVKHKASIRVDILDIPNQLVKAYRNLIDKWAKFKQANLALCDGRGVRRVGIEIENLFRVGVTNLRLVYASQRDTELIYSWQCHPKTRKYALTPDIPSWEEHQTWMFKKLRTTSDYFYILTDCVERKKLGVVRLERVKPWNYLVSIYVDPKFHGQGLASKALALVDSIHPDVTLHATVLEANIASQRLFQKAHYQKINDENYVRQAID